MAEFEIKEHVGFEADVATKKPAGKKTTKQPKPPEEKK